MSVRYPTGHGSRIPRARNDHSQVMHELGLTLGEVHEVLRRRAALSLDVDDKAPRILHLSHVLGKQGDDSSSQHQQGNRASTIFTMCYHPFDSVVRATTSSVQSTGLPVKPYHSPSPCSNRSPRRVRNRFRVPITPRRPSTASSASNTPHVTRTTASMVDNSSASTPASSWDGSFYNHVPQLDFGMVARLMSDVEALHRRVAVLEAKSGDLEEEMHFWKDKAERTKRETADPQTN
ncbi:MAG: hypothetical protein Q9218_003296 [Villophora microphyllina]